MSQNFNQRGLYRQRNARRFMPMINPRFNPGFRAPRRRFFSPFPVNPPRRRFVNHPYQFQTRRIVNRRNVNVPNTFRSVPSGINPSRPNSFFRRNNDTQIIRKRELWFSVVPGANKYVFELGESGVPHLDRFSKIYEQAQVRHIVIEYMPSSGTTIPGNLTMGVDYAPSNDRSPEGIPLLEPNSSGTIYQRHSIRPVVNRIMKGLSWIPTSAANESDLNSKCFALYVNAQTEATQIGQIWINYTVAFSTATIPSGSSTVTAIPLTVSNVKIVSDIITEEPVISNVGEDKIYEVTTSIPPQVNEVSQEGSFVETQIEFAADEWPVGTDFVIGTALTSPPSLYGMRDHKPPNITFMYSDGSVIPKDSIKPVDQDIKLDMSSPSSGALTDIFGTIFKILKPLAKPILGIINDLLEPLISAENAEGADLVNADSEIYSTFGFKGDTATISLPSLVNDNLATRMPLNLMFYGGILNTSARTVEYYGHQYYNYKDSWLDSVTVNKEGSLIWAYVVFKNPKGLSSFHNGDLIIISFNTIALDAGLGSNVYTPYSAPLSTDQIDQLVAGFHSRSSLSNTKEYLPSAPQLTLESYTNDSNSDTPATNVGVFLNFRFTSSDDAKSYPYAIIAFRYDILLVGANNTFSSGSSHPFLDYANQATNVTIQYFETDKLVKPASKLNFDLFNTKQLNK